MDNLTRQRIYLKLLKETTSDRAPYGLAILDGIYDHNKNQEYLMNVFTLAWQLMHDLDKLYPVPIVVKTIILCYDAKYQHYLDRAKDTDNPRSHALAFLCGDIQEQLELGTDDFENVSLLRRKIKS